jgi:hypothetical protein
MQINPYNSLPIITGYDRPRRQQQQTDHSQDKKTQQLPVPVEQDIIQSQYDMASTQRIRPTVNAQPLFNQQLSQTGEQARRTYEDIALSGDIELANRLDVIV